MTSAWQRVSTLVLLALWLLFGCASTPEPTPSAPGSEDPRGDCLEQGLGAGYCGRF